MRPPSWAIESARRLDLGEFGQCFKDLMHRLETDFFKVEVWQTYQEPGTASLEAFESGDLTRAESLVRAEADAEIDVYRTFRRKGVPFARLRVIEQPLTAYLRWELLNYVVRSEPRYGEDVRTVDVTGQVERLPDADHFDFIVFGAEGALVHDYGTEGLQTGGWLVLETEVLDRISGIARDLRARSRPLSDFVQSQGELLNARPGCEVR